MIKQTLLLIFICIFTINPLQVISQNEGLDKRFSAFQSYQDVEIPKDAFLNRVAIPFTENPENSFTIHETKTDRVQPYFTRFLYEPNPNKANIIDNSAVRTDINNLVDKNFKTSTTFDFEKTSNYSFITLQLSIPIKVSEINLYLDSNVKLPEFAQVSFLNEKNQMEVILSQSPNSSNTIKFPEVTSTTFKLELTHSQPLRLLEIELDKPTQKILEKQLVWLGRPGENYRIYSNSDRFLNTQNNDEQLFSIEDTIQTITPTKTQPNPLYIEEDSDEDGIPNKIDNCDYIPNENQQDLDKNDKGDSCEDRDGDNVIDGVDNCKIYPNQDQLDTNKNKVGDVCEDKDNDTIPDNIDNCIDVSNTNQKDTDQDKKGDVCDTTESRFFEKKEFTSWFAIGIAFSFISLLSYLTLRKK